MSASNASLNYSKTKAFSLSGRSHPAWQHFLRSNHITSWHDRHSTDPLTYLGYPICSSKLQQHNFANKFITNLKQLCHHHLHRNLTFRGRVTVLNTLLYSKLWHVMRLFTFTKAQLSTIQQIGASFVNHESKVTRFSFATLTLPQAQGGLSLLDPVLQANALQWRWLHPLLDPLQITPPHMVSLPYLKLFLTFSLSSSLYPTYHWSLLFPSCRPSSTTASLQPILTNLFRTVDSIRHHYEHCNADVSTCLRLLITELFVSSLLATHPASSTFVPPSQLIPYHSTMYRLIGSGIMHYDTETHSLKIHASSSHLPHRYSSNKIIQYVHSNQLHFQPFVLYNLLQVVPRTRTQVPSVSSDPSINVSILQSFLLSILSTNFVLSDHSFLLANASIASFKSLPLISNSYFLSPSITFSRWTGLWSLQIPLNARNTWFRILHNKITPRDKLNRYKPTQFTAHCSHCSRLHYHQSPPIETSARFLFYCPLKYEVWSTALATYVSSLLFSVTFTEYQQLLLMQSPFTTISPRNPYRNLSVYQVFACNQQAIWHFHYQKVFNNILFSPSIVLSYMDRSLRSLSSQLLLDTLL